MMTMNALLMEILFDLAKKLDERTIQTGPGSPDEEERWRLVSCIYKEGDPDCIRELIRTAVEDIGHHRRFQIMTVGGPQTGNTVALTWSEGTGWKHVRATFRNTVEGPLIELDWITLD